MGMLGLAVALEDIGCQGNLVQAADEDIQTTVKPDTKPVKDCDSFEVVN